jgi:hypothetical protein
MDKLIEENLFLTSFGKNEAMVLSERAKKDINNLESIINISS